MRTDERRNAGTDANVCIVSIKKFILEGDLFGHLCEICSQSMSSF